MRIPRDVSGDDFMKRLARLGYTPMRQTGSHVQMTRKIDGEHHITIPRHRVLKVGTLAAILKDVAEHLNMDRDTLLRHLFQ